MPTQRQSDDAFQRLLGVSQEYLDDIHKHVDEYRALHANDPPPVLWDGPGSDSESEDADGAPPSPPPSPRGDGLDLSSKAYERRIWNDVSRGLSCDQCAFGSYEKWRYNMISEHQKALPLSTSPSSTSPSLTSLPSTLPSPTSSHESGAHTNKSGIRKKQHHFTATATER